MGSFSLWHWIILLLIIFVPLILIDRARTPLARKPFTLRVLTVLGILLVLDFIAPFLGRPTIYMVALSLMGAIYGFILWRWVARRCLDIGRSKWWTLLLYIPMINILMIIALFFVPSRLGPDQKAIREAFD